MARISGGSPVMSGSVRILRVVSFQLMTFLVTAVISVAGQMMCLLPSGEEVPIGTFGHITSTCTHKCHCLAGGVAVCEDNVCYKDGTCQPDATGVCRCVSGYAGDGEYCVQEPVELTALGCYQEERPLRHFGQHVGGLSPSRMHPVGCLKGCALINNSYAAMAEGRYCFCANSLPDVWLRQDNDSLCNTSCASGVFPGYPCGGYGYVSVYVTPFKVDAVHVTVRDVTSRVQEILEPVRFGVEVSTAGVEYRLGIDFEDSGRLDEDNLVKVYTKPGQYRVRAVASDVIGVTPAMTDGITLLIVAPPRAVTILCPYAVPADEVFVCNGSVWQGSSMMASTDWSDGTTDNFNIADPKWTETGTDVKRNLTESNPPSYVISGGEHILIRSVDVFQFAGFLTSVEYHATAVGDVTLQILRPSCTYCVYKDSCSGACTLPLTTSCTGDLFCAYDQSCSDQCDVSDVSHPDTFDVIRSQLVSITQTGWAYQLFEYGQLPVEAGDRISVVMSGSGRIAMRVPLGGEDPDLLCGSDSSCGPSYTDIGHKLMIKAVSATPTPVVLYHTYAEEGWYQVTMTLSTEYLPTAADMNSTYVLVQEKITDLVIVAPDYAATNSLVLFSLLPHNGSNVTYEWDFGDGNMTNSSVAWILHAFDSWGSFNVSIRGFNLVHERHNWTEIWIEDELLGLNISSQPSVVDVLAPFQFVLYSGSHYACVWDWMDGSPNYLSFWDPTATAAGIQSSVHSHVFTRDLVFPVNVTCLNNVSSISDVTNHTVQYEIYDIHLAPYSLGSLRSVPFNFSFQLANGTDPVCDVTFDGVDVPNVYDVSIKTGWTPEGLLTRNETGFYRIEIYCENLVSSEWFVTNFTIDMPIINPESWPNVTVVVMEGSVAFYVTMDEGTSVAVHWDFADENTSDPDDRKADYRLAQLENWPRYLDGSLEIPYVHHVTHYYDTPGVYNVTVSVQNSYNYTEFHHIIYVMNIVHNLTVMSDSPVGYINRQGLVSIGFYTPEIPPILASVDILWGDGTPMECDLDLTMDLWPAKTFGPHAYPRLGSYEVWLNVSNMISWENYTATVWIILPIINFRIGIRDVYTAVGDTYLITASFGVGDKVTMEVDWGDGSKDSLPRQGTTFWDVDTLSHQYQTPGNMTVIIRAWNAVSSVTKTLTVICQLPVSDMFELRSSAPHVYPDTEVHINLTRDQSLALPTDAFVTFNFGDEVLDGSDVIDQLSLSEMFSTEPVYMTSHRYSTSGDFVTTVTVANEVSEMTFQVLSAVYVPLTRVEVTTVYKTELPSGGSWLDYDIPDPVLRSFDFDADAFVFPFVDPEDDQSGSVVTTYGLRVDTDGVLSAVAVELKAPDGQTFVYYSGTLDPELRPETDKNTTEIAYTPFGYPILIYNEDVSPDISVGEPNYLIALNVDQPAQYDVTVTVANPTSVLRKTFTLNINPTFSGMAVEPVPIAEPGSSQVFKITFNRTSPDGCVVVSFGDGTGVSYGTESNCQLFGIDTATYPIGGVVADMLLPVHVYRDEGSYTQTVSALSPGHSATTTSRIVVSAYRCKNPTVRIQTPAESFLDPVEIPKGSPVYLVAQTGIDCADVSNTKIWTITRADDDTGTEVAGVDLISVPSRNHSTLKLEAGFLDYGLYKATFTVTMSANPWFWSDDATYLRVTKSEITARLVAGIAHSVTRSWNKTITLEPEKYSIDLDDPSQSVLFSSFTWLCRQQYEKLAYDPEAGIPPDTPRTLILPYSSIEYALLHNVTLLPAAGGCFRQGPGVICNRDMTLYEKGTLSFNSLNMYKTEMYEATVMVQKDTRVAFGSVQLNIVEEDTLEFAISCIVSVCPAQPDGSILVNPSNNLRLKLSCFGSGLADCADVDVSWTMYFGGPHDTWKNAPEFNESAVVLNSAGVTILKERFSYGFELYSEMTKYKLQVRGRKSDGDVIGTSEVIITVNKPITAGSCDVTPLIGSRPNIRQVSCRDFYHKDGISEYKAYVKFGSEVDKVIFLTSSTVDTFVVEVPVGLRSDNFILQLWLQVFDTNRGNIDVLISNITSPPLSESQLQDALQTIELLLAEGNVKETTPFFTTVSSSLNELAKEDANNFNCVTAARYIGNGYSTAASSDDIGTPSSEQESDCLDEYNERRNFRSELRELMITGLLNFTVTSLDSVQVLASTMAELCTRPEEISRQSQEAVAQFITQTTNDLKTLADGLPLEEILPTLNPLISSVGSVLRSCSFLWVFPLDSDLKSAKESEYFYYDTFYDSDRIILSDYDPEDAEAALTMETNEIIQRDHSSKKTVNSLLASVDDMTSIVLSGISPVEDAVQIESSWFSMKIEKGTADAFTGSVQTVEDVSVYIPDYCQLVNETSECSSHNLIASVQMACAPFNIYGFLRNTPPALAPNPRSSSLLLTIFDENNHPMALAATKEPISINLPVETSIEDVPLATNVHAIMSPSNEDIDLFYHVINVQNQIGSLNVEVIPVDPEVQLAVYVRYNDFPDIRTGQWNVFGVVPRKMSQLGTESSYSEDQWLKAMYTVEVPTGAGSGGLGKWVVGIRQLDPDDHDRYDSENPLRTVLPLTGRFTTNYTIRSWTATCGYMEATAWQQVTDADPEWSQTGLTVGPHTTYLNTECVSTHLSMFSGGWAVKPNPIDFDYVFANVDFAKNPTLYTTEILILIGYILTAVWARRKDRRDVEKLGVTPLPDNLPEEKYYYTVSVQTGLRKEAGTKSKVFCIFAGDNEETDVRVLEDPKRPTFQRGSLDVFLMTTARSLGKLSYARIWHDNSGKGKYASWYLNYIIVKDLQTKQHFYFIVNDWFAVDQSDGKIDRLIPVANRDELIALKNLVTNKASQKLGDDHLWFSVIARPPGSRFTRLQRLSCCLLLLYTTMLANAMYYEVLDSSTTQGGAISFGPFSFSLQQLFVGVVSIAVVFPVNFAVVTFFRKARLRKKRPSRFKEAIELNEANMKRKKQQSVASSKTDPEQPKAPDRRKRPEDSTAAKSADTPVKDEEEPLVIMTNEEYTRQSTEKNESDKEIRADKTTDEKSFSLPWWFQIVAWVLIWVSVLLSATFVTFYGISFGDEKTRKWITSLVVSFFTSIFLTQPIKVFLAAVLFSMIFKKADLIEEVEEEEEDEIVGLEKDEEFLYLVPGQPGYRPKKRNISYAPPTEEELERARIERQKQKKMSEAIREISLHVTYVIVLLILTHDLQHPDSFLLRNDLANFMIDLNKGEFSQDKISFNQVQSLGQFWDWVENTMVFAIRSGKWYNGQQPVGQRGFLLDRVSRLMGYAVMRQIRVKADRCQTVAKMRPYVGECYTSYGFLDEDKDAYGVSWTELADTGNSSDVTTSPEYVYRTAAELNGWPYVAKHSVYGGGGYVAELKGSERQLKSHMTRLKSELWLDRRTRAVFVEFTVYNPNVNLFGIVTFVAEFTTSSYVDKSYRIEPMSLLRPAEGIDVISLLAELAFVIYLIVFIIKEIRKATRMRGAYLRDIWNYNELAIIGLSSGALVVYIYRLLLAKEKTAFFRETQGNAYMKFQYVAFWNELLSYVAGWLCFLNTVKFLRLLRFNKQMGMLGSVIRASGRPLAAYMVVFTIVLMAFVQEFYLTYMTSDENFSTVTVTLETLLLMLIGKFTNFRETEGAVKVLGLTFFLLYVVGVCYIVFEMFMAIINGAIEEVNADMCNQSNDFEVIEHMIQTFMDWTGLGNLFRRSEGAVPSVESRSAEERTSTEASLDHLMEELTEKVDSLVDRLVSNIISAGTFESSFVVNAGKGVAGKVKAGDTGAGLTEVKDVGSRENEDEEITWQNPLPPIGVEERLTTSQNSSLK